jgi:hypothetical protein
MRSTSLFAISLLMLASTASFAQLQPGQPGYVEEGAEAKPKAKPFPLHINASTTQSLGSGTFVAGFADNPLFATNVNLNPWASWNGWMFSVNQNIDIEWTQSDLTTHPQQVILGDMRFGAMYPGLRFGPIGTVFSFAADAPLSMQSRWNGMVTGLTARAGANWTWKPAKLTLAASLGARQNFFVPGLARTECNSEGKSFTDDAGNEQVPLSFICRDPNEPLSFGGGLMPRGLIWSAGVNANWVIGNGWSMGGGVTGIQLLSIYDPPDDELASPNANPGPGSLDFLSAWVGVNWSVKPWLLLSGSVSSFDFARSALGDFDRVPIFDSLLFHPARNGTTYNISTTFMY